MPENSELTIVIVTYNSYQVVTDCLDELLTSKPFPVIVVDNASSDDSGNRLKQQYPHIQLIQSHINLGYGRAANRAIAVTKTPYLLLINPDLKATSQAVGKLFEHMLSCNDNTALIAPAVFVADHTQSGMIAKDHVIGAAMLFNLEALKTVGYFDENIFLFSEEDDLCLRIKKAGFMIYLDSDIYIEHLYRQSSIPSQAIEDLKNWHMAWSRAYFYNKHGLAVGKKNPKRMLALYWIKYLLATKKQKKALYKARYKGTMAFLRGRAAFREDEKPQTAR